jgi:hypothetical protein
LRLGLHLTKTCTCDPKSPTPDLSTSQAVQVLTDPLNSFLSFKTKKLEIWKSEVVSCPGSPSRQGPWGDCPAPHSSGPPLTGPWRGGHASAANGRSVGGLGTLGSIRSTSGQQSGPLLGGQGWAGLGTVTRVQDVESSALPALCGLGGISSLLLCAEIHKHTCTHVHTQIYFLIQMEKIKA